LQMNRNQLPHPISHSEINQSLYHFPSSGLFIKLIFKNALFFKNA
jgi:hypothetical protein